MHVHEQSVFHEILSVPIRLVFQNQVTYYSCDNLSYFMLYVTESRKTVPNHTFLFHHIYYCNMNGITFSTLFHIITWNLMLKLRIKIVQ